MKKEFSIKKSAAAASTAVVMDDLGITCRDVNYLWKDIDGIIYFRANRRMSGIKTNEMFVIFLRSKLEPKKWMDLSTTIAMGAGKAKAVETFEQMTKILFQKVETPLYRQFEDELKSGKTISFNLLTVNQAGVQFKNRKHIFAKSTMVNIPWSDTTIGESSVPECFYVGSRTDQKLSKLLPKRHWNANILRRYIIEYYKTKPTN